MEKLISPEDKVDCIVYDLSTSFLLYPETGFLLSLISVKIWQ